MAAKKQRFPADWTWIMVFAISAALVAWGLVNYVLIREQPRSWNYGTLPDVPGQSVYSSEETPRGLAVPGQAPKLPEAVPNGTDNGSTRPEGDTP